MGISLEPFYLRQKLNQFLETLWFYTDIVTVVGDRGNTLVKVLCYKSEGRWFDPS